MYRNKLRGVYLPALFVVGILFSLFVLPTASAQGGTTQRITFPVGATSVTVYGQVNGSTINTYLLNARAGQFMQISVTPQANLFLTVISPNGTSLMQAQQGVQNFSGTLPLNGDYTIQVSAQPGAATTNYSMFVSVTGSTSGGGTTQRITFAPGATSASVNGQVSGFTINTYLLEARAGQTMQITLWSPAGSVFLTVISPGGTPLARAEQGAQSFNGTLPENGDYTIQVSAQSGAPTISYTLTVSVTGGSGPVPGPTVRISFPTGATSTSVNGQVGGYTVNYYLVNARAGQFMQTSVSSPGNNVFMSVVTPSGQMLASAPQGARSFSGTLPETGDYTLRISTTPGGANTSYTVFVSITGGSSGGGTTQRINFAPGTTSTTVSGQVSGSFINTYLLNARAGQTMQLSVSSPAGNVFLTLVSPLGSPLARAQNGAQGFSGTLPETGDYTIQISAPSGTPTTSFTLFVTVV